MFTMNVKEHNIFNWNFPETETRLYYHFVPFISLSDVILILMVEELIIFSYART